MHWFLTALMVCGVVTLAKASEAGPSATAQDVAFFENRIRPLLAENCYQCHSGQSDKIKAGLRLDSRENILAGGESGPAAIVGDPEGSILIKAVRYADSNLQMPPKKGKLPDAKIADLTNWVRLGMPWPAESQTNAPLARRAFEITDRDRAYWAFQPIKRPPVPPVAQAEWVANGIDAFILAALEAKGIGPNPPATRRELVRRVYFDVIGLPPSPAEVRAFEQDDSPATYEQLVDRLLARPEYGEHWARHWLDLVRFAQSNGYERDGEKPLAWRYRDYVVQSLNEDKRYDRFIQEQLAGDELPDATAESIVATGFQRLGVWDDEPDDRTMAEFDELDDIISTTGVAFLGLTLGCARCHDHKFDPISQSDYYRFQAFFRNVRANEDARYSLDSPNYVPLASPQRAREWLRQKEFRMQALESQLACISEGPQKAALLEQLRSLQSESWPGAWALAVRERGTQPLPTHVLIRGNPRSPGPEVEPGFLSVLGGQAAVAAPGAEGSSTGRRLALARWIASEENPLTARVAVNRLWHYHFGQGLVRTTADFGHAGTGPTHPQLLDWLAAEFIETGWSVKRLHRLILLSNTYQMSSRRENEKALELDPSDDLLWHQRLRRLDAESVWDAALTVSGELNPAMGGRGFFPHLDGEVLAGESRPGLDWEISSGREQVRRSLYTYIRRTMLAPLLEAFDYSNTTSPLAERPVTTVAPQALMLLNSSWSQQRADAFAARLDREAGFNPRDRIKFAFQLAFGRQPSESEIEVGLQFLQRQSQLLSKTTDRLTFQLDVPNSLFEGYMKQLQPPDFLHGPQTGWRYYMGRWSGAYEGIRTMDKQRGPFALWTGQEFADGVVQADLLVQPASEFGSLLIRCTADGHEPRGYEIVLDPRHQQVLVRRHDRQVEILSQVPAKIPRGQPFPIRIALTGPRLRIWLNASCAGPENTKTGLLNEATEGGAALVDVVDPKPVPGRGYLGVRTSQGGLSLDHLTLETALGRVPIFAEATARDAVRSGLLAGRAPSDALVEQRAWQSFCLLLLNLNEFVYVD